jgi:outer membrane protein OmpA-like peptidoglycan-associated protein
MRPLLASTLLLVACLTACAKKPSPTPAVTAPPVAQVVVAVHKPHAPLLPSIPPLRFGFDSDTLTYRQVKAITRFCEARGGSYTVTGYASPERSGKYKEAASAAYNRLLAGRRAYSVAFILRGAGCPADTVIGGEWKTQNLPSARVAVVKRK